MDSLKSYKGGTFGSAGSRIPEGGKSCPHTQWKVYLDRDDLSSCCLSSSCWASVERKCLLPISNSLAVLINTTSTLSNSLHIFTLSPSLVPGTLLLLQYLYNTKLSILSSGRAAQLMFRLWKSTVEKQF